MAIPDLEPTHHPGGGEARRLEARWRPVHVCQRNRASLSGARTPRVRPRRAGGAGRPGLGLGDPATVQGPQPIRSRVRVRTEFMRHKRHEARSARGHARERARAVESAPARAAAEGKRAQRQIATQEHARKREAERDVVPWLLALGFRSDEARRAAAECESIPEASLEERVRLALSRLRPPHRRLAPSP